MMSQYLTFDNNRIILIHENDGIVVFESRVDTEAGVVAYEAMAYTHETGVYAVLASALREYERMDAIVDLSFHTTPEQAIEVARRFVATSKKLIGS